MLTQDELIALVELLNRVPMTQAEKLWANSIVAKLQATIPPPKKEPQK